MASATAVGVRTNGAAVLAAQTVALSKKLQRPSLPRKLCRAAEHGRLTFRERLVFGTCLGSRTWTEAFSLVGKGGHEDGGEVE
eukprot:g1082.t1